MALKPIPASYLQPIENGGKIVRVDYTTSTYDSNPQQLNKFCYVYLPYGYDETKKYNVLYCLHGGGGEIEVYFGNGENEAPAPIKLTLDNMIANGDIEPIIAVSPTYFCEAGEFSEGAQTVVNHFRHELVNDLIPAVEGKFSTYAETTDPAGIKASRGHRAYTGFSLGSLSTWSTFLHSLDYIQYYMPMSGDCFTEEQTNPNFTGDIAIGEAAARRLEKVCAATDLPYRIYVITGDKDLAYVPLNTLMKGIATQAPSLKIITDENPDGNISYEVEPEATHDYKYMPLYFYNGLPNFWK